MQDQIDKLNKDVADLKAWKDQRTRQQISYPLDSNSIAALGKYFFHIVRDVVLYFGGASGRGFETLFVQQDNSSFQITRDSSQIYSVDPSSDVFTATRTPYPNDTQVSVFTEDTQPSPLVLGTTYYVVSTSGLTFKLAATSGGSAINITTVGVGIQHIDYAV